MAVLFGARSFWCAGPKHEDWTNRRCCPRRPPVRMSSGVRRTMFHQCPTLFSGCGCRYLVNEGQERPSCHLRPAISPRRIRERHAHFSAAIRRSRAAGLGIFVHSQRRFSGRGFIRPGSLGRDKKVTRHFDHSRFGFGCWKRVTPGPLDGAWAGMRRRSGDRRRIPGAPGSGAYLGLDFRRAIFRLIMSGTLIFMRTLIANASSLASPSALPPGPADGLSRAELDHYQSIKAWRPLVADLDGTLIKFGGSYLAGFL
jgi:hypothetical protein